MPGAAFSASDQCHSNIVDIGAGGPCEDQPFHCLQGVVGIVVLQSVKNIPARCSQCGGGVAVHIAACGIGRAVGAVTAHREHTAVFQPRKGRGSGKRNNSGDRQQEVSEISRSLKALARELDVPVLALSQLSRSVESRQVKRPMLSDLRESGSLEQDADIVAFLYREDYYNPETENKHTELIIAKHRNGPVDTVNLFFQKQFTKFVGFTKRES